MAIRHRRGKFVDFDPNKMLSGEFGYALDRGELYYCYSPGNVKKLTTAEDVQAILNSSETAYSALQQLLIDLETNPSELTNILNNISALQSDKLDKLGDSKDNITTFTEYTEELDIVSGEKQSTLFGKILKSIKTFRTAIGVLASLSTVEKTNLVSAINELVNGKIDKNSIVHTTETNSTTKVPSSAVTHGLGQDITNLQNDVGTINSNLAWESWQTLTLLNDWAGTLQVRKNGLGIIQLKGGVTVGVKDFGTIIAQLPTGFNSSYFKNVEFFSATGDLIDGIAITQDGNLVVYRPAASSLATGITGYIDQFYNVAP